ncbi:Cellulose binding domain-containing protein [Micromonospora pattaloongensis]|uniref:Cellulose binding domain-containing protein n=1 Tax=Micromonospora pattaloongensis TaxID=405436 RepID=A0A1H3M106_9ACTN|nr:cellulose binding domain-containing protein [Micromonospora pattaloongensis]SDY70437.1 Cellulose binding domain-containing protein [Micromonospora pattaloongensis]
MARHASQRGVESPQSRSSLALGVVIALIIGAGVWAVFHGRGIAPPMLIVQPAAALSAPPENLPASDPVTPGPTPSRTGSPSPSASPSRPPSPAPSASRSGPVARPGTPLPVRPATSAAPPPAPTRGAAPQPDFRARYSVTSDWYGGFVAAVDVTNRGAAGGRFELRLTYPRDVRITVRQYWGDVTASASGRTLVFTSKQPLTGGAALQLGFRADRSTRRAVAPTSCTVNGVPCELS